MSVDSLLKKTATKYIVLLLAFFVLAFVSWSFVGTDTYDLSRREVMLRQIGHQMLLQAGDSTSRVLPVRKLATNSYQIRFEKELSFQPDSLVGITKRILDKDPFSSDYTVNVLDCGGADVAYAFAISGSTKDELVACSGRIQPVSCYSLLVSFKPEGLTEGEKGYILGSLPVFALSGLWFFRGGRRRRKRQGTWKIGAMDFDEQAKVLIFKGLKVELTGTEARILRIFAEAPNQVVERSRLQQEIWERVIVSRSLDMFISKLRKKLEIDASVKIEVVRGIGFVLKA
jgi:hypothetical protein